MPYLFRLDRIDDLFDLTPKKGIVVTQVQRIQIAPIVYVH